VTEKALIHVVDDDDSLRAALLDLLDAAGFAARGYASTGEFLLQPPADRPGCVLLDVRLPGPSGLDLQAALQRHAVALPVVFLTGHADVPTSVRAMKAGAVDFLEKPVERDTLLEALERALARDAAQRKARDEAKRQSSRLAALTPREREVFDRIVAGKLNRQIADDLGIDSSRVGVGGVSAGGGLAAAVALMARDRGGPFVAFQMLMFPVLDDRMETTSMTFVDTPLFDGPAAARMWSTYLDANRSAISPYAAPARADDLRGLPPTYLATGEFDPLRDEGIAYAVRLLAADVSVELHNFAGTFHTFDVFPTAISTRAANEQVEWLRRIAHRLKDSMADESVRQSTDGAST